jgi:hypothetical protein
LNQKHYCNADASEFKKISKKLRHQVILYFLLIVVVVVDLFEKYY